MPMVSPIHQVNQFKPDVDASSRPINEKAMIESVLLMVQIRGAISR